MKIVYVCDYNSGTGYATFGIDTMLALDAAGVEVVPRSFKLANQFVAPPKRILELEKNNTNNVDITIQHTLPPYFSYYKNAGKNIGLFHCETTHFAPSTWQHNINLLDEALVSCPENKLAASKSGVVKPVKVIPKGCDASLYNRELYHCPFNKSNRFVFYHIGDYSERKNVKALIKCYLETFNKSDQVVLVLKTYVEGKSPQDSQSIIANDILDIKKSMRKYTIDNYPHIVLIADYISPNDIMALHAHGNCFLTLEAGAGYNLPAFDACAMGNWSITSGWGGQTQFIENNKNGWLLDYKMVSVGGMAHCPYPSVYTCHEQWSSPDQEQFKSLMRMAYEMKIKPSEEYRQYMLGKYSYQNVGKEILSIIQ